MVKLRYSKDVIFPHYKITPTNMARTALLRPNLLAYLLALNMPIAAKALDATVQGNISTDSENVKYALVELVNESNQNRYSAISNESGYYVITDVPLAVKGEITLPDKLKLGQNYPNPFNPSTVIPYEVGERGHITLKVYDILGGEVKTLVDKVVDRGSYSVEWRDINNQGNYVSSGICIYVLTDGEKRIAKKMAMLDSGAGVSTRRSNSMPNRTLGRSLENILSGTYRMEITNTEATEPAIRDTIFYNIHIDSSHVTINVVVQLPRRIVTGTVIDRFAQAPADSILLISSIDSARTNSQGEFSLEAAIDREDIPILHPSILTGGVILPASPNDTTLTLYIARGDSANGIDRDYFRDWVVGNRRGGPPFPPDGIYVSFTEETRNDTVWVGGYIIRPSDSLIVSYPFQNVALLNEIAKTINEEGSPIIYNSDITTIAIADSNFNNPDSTAKFQYSNMVVVPNEMFPAELEEIRNATTFRGSQVALGFNGTIYGEDEVTVIGNTVILGNNLTLGQMDGVISEEFYESDKGGIESELGYPSIIERFKPSYIKDPTSHDGRMRDWIVFMRPGAIYPAFPKGFNPELIEKYAPGVLGKMRVSNNLPVDFSKFHYDKATGLHLKVRR